jgi:hypothetical protein
MNIEHEPRGRRPLDDDRYLIDHFALDHDLALDDHRLGVWNEHDVRSALRASIPPSVISVPRLLVTHTSAACSSAAWRVATPAACARRRAVIRLRLAR